MKVEKIIFAFWNKVIREIILFSGHEIALFDDYDVGGHLNLIFKLNIQLFN